MITKGKIVSTPGELNENIYSVRIPYFESAGINQKQIFSCTVCGDPGIVNGLRVDDTVFVAFEDGKNESPVIIGKLFTNNDSDGTSYAHFDSLTVDNFVSFGNNGKLGNVSFKDIEGAVQQVTAHPLTINSPVVKLIGVNSRTITGKQLQTTANYGAIPFHKNEVVFRFRLESGTLCVGDKIQITKRQLVTHSKANKSKRYVQRACLSIEITEQNVNEKYFEFVIDIDNNVGLKEFKKLSHNKLRGLKGYYEPCEVRVRRPQGKDDAQMFNSQSLALVFRAVRLNEDPDMIIDHTISIH